tara:strand:- start:19 stop:912 length:894 start_codon:yes stop_codon:yes gene_type:complete
MISSVITSRSLNSALTIKTKAPWAVRFIEVADRGTLIKHDNNEDDEDDEDKNRIKVLEHKIKFLESTNATLLLKCGASIQNIRFSGEQTKNTKDLDNIGVTSRGTLDMMINASLVWKKVNLDDDDVIGLSPIEMDDVSVENKDAWLLFESALESGQTVFSQEEIDNSGINNLSDSACNVIVKTKNENYFIPDVRGVIDEYASYIGAMNNKYNTVLSDEKLLSEFRNTTNAENIAYLENLADVDPMERPHLTLYNDSESIKVSKEKEFVSLDQDIEVDDYSEYDDEDDSERSDIENIN